MIFTGTFYLINIPFIFTAFTGTPDTTRPVVICPASRTVTSSAALTPVIYTQLATATDNSGATPTITYSPVSGSNFAQGQTTVTVTATDPSNNQTICTFTITVSPSKI